MTEQLYIGNATRQILNFQYRVSKEAPLREQVIPSGEQVKISGELTPAQVDYIVQKQAKYGVVAADTIDQARGFIGVCYSIGKPITSVRLTLLMQKNHEALVGLGRSIREQAAIAQNNMLETALIENGRPERLTELEITVQQERKDPEHDLPQFSEGFRVIRGGVDAPRPKKARGRRAA